MKKLLLTCFIAVPAMMLAQTTIISDNFDNYTSGNTIGAESAGLWDTWSGGSGTAEDPFVSNTFSSSASNSMNVYNGGAGVYLHDVILPFPSVYTTGIYEFKMKIYIAAGSGGYFNLGSVWTTGGGGYEYGADVYFNTDGSGHISTPSNGVFSYSQDAWTDVSLMVNLGTTSYEVFIDGNSVGVFTWGAAGGFGVADIFGIAYTNATAATEATSNFYVDDVELLDWTGVGVAEHDLSIAMNVLPNPSNGQFAINLNNIESGNYTLTINDMLGNLVHNEVLNVSRGSTSLKYDLDLNSGFYFVNITNGKYFTTKKIAIK